MSWFVWRVLLRSFVPRSGVCCNGSHEKPLQKIGSVDAAEVNRVSEWLADLTAEHRLPQKLLVLHRFTKAMVRHEDEVETDHDEVGLLVHMDGQGSPG